MRERIVELMSVMNMSPSRFGATIGVKAANMSHILSGRNNPSLDFAQNILRAFPDVNTDWLILGIGNMFRDGENSVSPVDSITINQPELFEGDEDLSIPVEQPIRKQPQSLISEASKPNITSVLEAGSNNSSTNALDNAIQNSDIEQVMVFYKNKRVSIYKAE